MTASRARRAAPGRPSRRTATPRARGSFRGSGLGHVDASASSAATCASGACSARRARRRSSAIHRGSRPRSCARPSRSQASWTASSASLSEPASDRPRLADGSTSSFRQPVALIHRSLLASRRVIHVRPTRSRRMPRAGPKREHGRRLFVAGADVRSAPGSFHNLNLDRARGDGTSMLSGWRRASPGPRRRRSCSICSTLVQFERLSSEAGPDAIVHQATAPGGRALLQGPGQHLRGTNRLRRERRAPGRRARFRRFVAQSYASMRYTPERAGRSVPRTIRSTPPRRPCARLSAAVYLPRRGGSRTRAESRFVMGLRLRAVERTVEPVRKRQFPIVGDGGGVSLHPSRRCRGRPVLALETTARRSTTSSTTSRSVREWLPVLGKALEPSRRVASRSGSRGCSRAKPAPRLGTRGAGASNAKAKR